MNLLWIAVAAVMVAAIAAGAWFMRSRGAGEDRSKGSLDFLDTLTSWEPTPTRVLTSQERLAYAVLAKALPDYVILAQVPLSRFLKVPTRNSYTEWLSRVGQLCADLVVCDHSSEVVAVVDVRQPPSQASERNRKRHERMGRVLKAAGIPLHVWIENALPSPEAAREAILSKMSAAATKAAAGPAAAKGPVPAKAAGKALPTLADETEGVSPDEVIELGEPPPSTWFDDLETRPAPLKPPTPPRTPPR